MGIGVGSGDREVGVVMRKSARPRAELYMADRANGMSYTEIAKKHGISKQAVAAACARTGASHFRPYNSERVIYPNLRKWLNENKVTTSEFARRMGNLPESTTLNRIRGWFSGACYPVKESIDKILAVTGLTYEELWEVEHEN